jgi:hypothetical protein
VPNASVNAEALLLDFLNRRRKAERCGFRIEKSRQYPASWLARSNAAADFVRIGTKGKKNF